MKKIIHNVLIILLLLSALFQVPATHADYVLPYPSYMPGNKMYKISRIIDVLRKYWNWGGIATAKYHMELTDKYLVEAKTLFEYKQYLLASDALRRSDSQAEQISASLGNAHSEGVDTAQLKSIIMQEMQVHIAVLDTLKQQMPAVFIWRPEKSSETRIEIERILNQSRLFREKIVDSVSL